VSAFDLLNLAGVPIGGLAFGLFVLWLTGRRDRAAHGRVK